MAARNCSCCLHNGGACCCFSGCSSFHGYHIPAPDFHIHQPPPPVCHSHLDSDPCHVPKSRHYYDHFQDAYFREGRQNNPATVSALLRRIAVLESALFGRSSRASAGLSLRDAAARRIQAQFRIFLLRRSRTLRHLKDLASIKSSLGVLKSSVSENPQFDFQAVLRRALNLQLRLDGIEGVDPMIRNGKSALNRDLDKFLDFLDAISLEDHVWYEGNNLKSGRGRNIRESNPKFEDANKVNLRKLIRKAGDIKEKCVEADEGEDPFEYVIRKDGRFSGLAKKPQGGIKIKGGAKKHVTFADDDGKVYPAVEDHHHLFSGIQEIRVSPPKEANDDDEDEEEEIETEFQKSGNGSSDTLLQREA